MGVVTVKWEFNKIVCFSVPSTELSIIQSSYIRRSLKGVLLLLAQSKEYDHGAQQERSYYSFLIVSETSEVL